MSKKFYSVANGRKVGIYETWEDCQKQVFGYPHAAFKCFRVRADAEKFLSIGTQEVLQREAKQREMSKRQRFMMQQIKNLPL